MATKKVNNGFDGVLKIAGAVFLSSTIINIVLKGAQNKSINTAYLKRPWEFWK